MEMKIIHTFFNEDEHLQTNEVKIIHTFFNEDEHLQTIEMKIVHTHFTPFSMKMNIYRQMIKDFIFSASIFLYNQLDVQSQLSNGLNIFYSN